MDDATMMEQTCSINETNQLDEYEVSDQKIPDNIQTPEPIFTCRKTLEQKKVLEPLPKSDHCDLV